VNEAIVADASAILAVLKGEPFGEFDQRRLFGAAISAVNFSEVLEKLCSGGATEAAAESAAAGLKLEVVVFDAPQARAAARLRSVTRHAGLSLGDRACLALATSFGHPAVTADRAWANLDIGVEVILVR
jgi:PIN domain nuclease of toxin-antitoxin system